MEVAEDSPREYSVIPGETLSIIVGGKGTVPNWAIGGWFGGGGAGGNGVANAWDCGGFGGGGRSEILAHI